ncbi:ABC transporter permease [Nocardioides jishulii]|uniref:ABC transporter permease n=1 Tax=Nocardioides jishulii TaxID=2575440 RepID=A0A4U2YJK2_9ACTN|nr:ABC transporter permease [Nocardioides jishulii]QCX26864.1 ABC transporter permease [Nocardioides jishulii]TKI61347.1 ABC transporter permease [Nocardioides jishulii]
MSAFRAGLVSELRKSTSTSLWWILAGGAFLYLAFMGAVMAFAVSVPVEEGGMGGEGMDPLALVQTIYSLPTAMGYVFPLVFGALSITGEFRHRTLTSSLVADPSRTRLIVSKVLVQGGFGALIGACSILGAVLAAALVFAATDVDPFLGSPEVWTTLGLSVLALALWGMVGVGFGALVPNQVASIVMILAFTQLLEPILRLALGAMGDATAQVSLYFPGAAAEALVGSSIYTAIGASELLSRWAGGLVLLAYAVLFALVGRFTTLRRDLT